MSNLTPIHLRRLREIVLIACSAWLVLQNLILFALLALFPPSELGTAALVLIRVAVRAATPLAIAPDAGLIEIAAALLAAGMGVHHG
jgi:hypothetical protein